METSGSLRNLQEASNFLRNMDRGEDRENMYRPYRAKPGPGAVVGASALPGQGGKAGGAGCQGWWRLDQP